MRRSVRPAPPASPPLEICILAGGRSFRMGRPKAALRLGGRSLLAHARATARATGHAVRVIRQDDCPGLGPLGGMVTAFRRSRADKLAFLSCDQPFLRPESLRAFLTTACKAPATFAAHRGRVGFPFVLDRLELTTITRQVAAGELSLQALARKTRAVRWPWPRPLVEELFNVNTPEDFAEARRRWKLRAG